MRAQVRALNEKLALLSAKVAAAVPLPSNCTVVVIPAPGSSGAPASVALPPCSSPAVTILLCEEVLCSSCWGGQAQQCRSAR